MNSPKKPIKGKATKTAGDKNFELWEEFVRVREQRLDWIDFADKTLTVFSPVKVSTKLGFNARALGQNSRIRASREELEKRLRSEGVFKTPVDQGFEPRVHRDSLSKDKQRIMQLESANAELRAECESLKERLKKANLFEAHLFETGRALPL
ncbi:hypothetical protein [Congregibacter litoralis]|uniref:hypothetical protein n=1 Tax=Congregibacter litoralis TaxID=393662 RepID=UPI00006AF0C9|nr:hypothetical protein [Congregibacter litoralis]